MVGGIEGMVGAMTEVGFDGEGLVGTVVDTI
jgi:hypothetical protein